MIAFERFLMENGFELIGGSGKELNTYDNCGRSYKNKDGKTCTVGLFAQPTRIGITHPYIILPEANPFTNLPEEKNFEEILTQILA